MSHIRAWPLRYHKAPNRTLAILTSTEINTEHKQSYEASNWQEIKMQLFLRNLLLYAGPLAQQPWLPDAVADPDAHVYCDQELHPISIAVRRGRYVRRITPASSWSDQLDLANLRALFDLAGVGDHSTPSAFGHAMMAETWPADARRLARPAEPIWQTLHATSLGGRAEVWRPRERFRTLYEVDRNSGYPASALLVPSGTAYHTNDLDGVTGYYQCAWTAVGDALLALGVRGDDHRLAWPTAGTHVGWYWQEEIRHALNHGVHVQIIRGYAWPRLEPVLAQWALAMYQLRWQAPDPAMVKKASVAAIGRFLSERVERTLIARPMAGDVRAIDPDHGPTGYWIHEQFRERPDALMHVGSYILMQCRMALLRRMEQERRQSLVASNFDAIYTVDKPENSSYEIGDWKWHELTNATIPNLRQLESDQKRQHPGLTTG